ncbi:hypothetical protein [Asticcacaulis machinosus]|uniref:SMODS and SLOG-associating 2TM effector domain-containing protein n=1 Tax=Asticcacaulis machinosus TaxID=2984211 RepID=A0ABT5HEK8_9CAUL|nr:hypothetical protein [Asticcacaulis machinosus]MDC7674691.1 hypothetical protein [Asticcacaulis machinosus]
MINCLSPVQKLFVVVWAAIGFAMIISALAIQQTVVGVFAPETVSDGLDNAAIFTILIVAAAYIGLSVTIRGQFEFLDRVLHALSASFLKNHRSEGRVTRWMAERQIIEGWEEHVGRTGCAINFENLCGYLFDEYEIEIDELDDWRRNGSARKNLTDAQARQIIKAVAENVGIA